MKTWLVTGALARGQRNPLLIAYLQDLLRMKRGSTILRMAISHVSIACDNYVFILHLLFLNTRLLSCSEVLWRGTSFVGCAEHTKILNGSGKKCHIQVCRYAKPGNCNMGRYKNYKVPMLADDSPCGPSI